MIYGRELEHVLASVLDMSLQVQEAGAIHLICYKKVVRAHIVSTRVETSSGLLLKVAHVTEKDGRLLEST